MYIFGQALKSPDQEVVVPPPTREEVIAIYQEILLKLFEKDDPNLHSLHRDNRDISLLLYYFNIFAPSETISQKPCYPCAPCAEPPKTPQNQQDLKFRSPGVEEKDDF